MPLVCKDVYEALKLMTELASLGKICDPGQTYQGVNSLCHIKNFIKFLVISCVGLHVWCNLSNNEITTIGLHVHTTHLQIVFLFF